MYEQSRRLARQADRPNVTLHILPLNSQHMIFGESFVPETAGSYWADIWPVR